MNRKLIFIPLMILTISFSAGIFTEIAIPSDSVQISTNLPSVYASIFAYIKSDGFTVISSLIFSVSVFLMPLVPLLILGKTFSLGFSAAYILSSSAEQAFGIVISALVPRAVFKIPAYLAIVLTAAETASFIRSNYQNPPALAHGIKRHLLRFILCFFILAASSILEACLLQGVL